MRKIKTAIIPIAGIGTRMAPLSHSIPKDFLPVGIKPLIQHSVEELVDAGIENIILAVTYRNISTYIKHFMPAPYFSPKEDTAAAIRSLEAKELYKRLTFCPITENSKGSGDTLLQAMKFIPPNEPFFILFPDDLITGYRGKNVASQLLEQYNLYERSEILIASMSVDHEQVSKYGIFRYSHESSPSQNLSKVASIIEKPKPEWAPSNDAVVGRFILPYEAILKLEAQLNSDRNRHSELNIIDVVQELIEEGCPAYRYRFDGTRFDCGDPVEYLKAVHHFSSPESIEGVCNLV